MKILVKLGGTLLDAAESRNRLASELAALQSSGIQLVVVHGGGKQMTRFLAERGIDSQFVRGLRVTTPGVIDAVLKVLAGTVNSELVSALVAHGANAVGLTGIDACLTEAVQLDPELGLVGQPVRTDPRLLEVLVRNQFLPVIACVAGGREGQIFNVNADQMAASCAVGFCADQLIFLTDVDGVLRNGKIIPQLNLDDCQELIRTGVATGGMQAKLLAAAAAIENGVGSVVIAPGAEANIVSRLLAGESAGSRLISSGAEASHA